MSKSTPRTVSLKELDPKDIIILVVGPSGSGKSSFVNSASGIGHGIVGHELVSKTREILAVKYTDEESDQEIVLVDTPGFSNTFKDDSEVMRMIMGWSRKLKKRGIVIAGILYFHKISDNRIPGNPLKALCVFGELCGGFGAALSKTILTLTMWNDVDEATGDKRLAELEGMNFWNMMLKYKEDVETARELVHEVLRRQGPMSSQNMAPTDQESARLALVKDLETLAERQLSIFRNIEGGSRNSSELELEYRQLRLQMDEAWHKLCNHGQAYKGHKPPVMQRLLPRGRYPV
ncbi:hypothetical protein EDD16DRAFT_1716274 [Pisolithus croceorrhizus]|nr:hypothetical protein EDD16DRAFT_1716274 [Pisolithus croceorrhizus]KAI6168851.1 hypothetical protein EDD17DRAFT_1868784 [Pisolithus thermaeus]